MIWDHLLRRLKATVELDAVLRNVYGDSMRLTGTGDHAIPMLEWMLITDAEDELWAPHTVQFDQFAASLDVVMLSERRLRALFHQELPVELGGMLMWSQYRDGEITASPGRHGYSGRAIRFQFTPLRDRYAGLAAQGG